jgi:hypothetical protein
MRTTDPGDAACIELLLAELRLPAIKLVWASLAAQADKEGWPAGRFLAALAEHEIAERSRRRLERHLAEARLLLGKTLDSFDFEAVPVVSKAQVMALAAGDAWLNNAHYDERCFLPIHVYDTASARPVAVLLRPGKTPSGKEVRGHLRRLASFQTCGTDNHIITILALYLCGHRPLEWVRDCRCGNWRFLIST